MGGCTGATSLQVDREPLPTLGTEPRSLSRAQHCGPPGCFRTCRALEVLSCPLEDIVAIQERSSQTRKPVGGSSLPARDKGCYLPCRGILWEWLPLPLSRGARTVAVAGLGARTISLVTGLGDACLSCCGRWRTRLRPRACLAGVALLCSVARERGLGLRGHSHENEGRLFLWFVSLCVPLSAGQGRWLKSFSSVPF